MPLLSAILSFFVPGLGQVLQGRFTPAALYAGLWMIGVILWGIGGPDTFFYVVFGEARYFPLDTATGAEMTGAPAAVAMLWSWGVGFFAARDAWRYGSSSQRRSPSRGRRPRSRS